MPSDSLLLSSLAKVSETRVTTAAMTETFTAARALATLRSGKSPCTKSLRNVALGKWWVHVMQLAERIEERIVSDLEKWDGVPQWNAAENAIAFECNFDDIWEKEPIAFKMAIALLRRDGEFREMIKQFQEGKIRFAINFDNISA